MKQTNAGSATTGIMSRRTLSTQLFVAATLITVLVMAVLASLITMQNRAVAIDNVRDANQAGLLAFDRTLQQIFRTAQDRNESLYPVLVRYMAGEPAPSGETANGLPVFKSSGMPINDDQEMMQSVTGIEAELFARTSNGWTRLAGAFQDQASHAVGLSLDAGDPLAKALEGGNKVSVPALMNDKWHMVTVIHLKDAQGMIYGGFLIWLDISQQIDPMLAELAATRLAEHGSLFVLRPSTDGKDWIRIAGSFGKPGDSLSQGNPARDFQLMDNAFRSQDEGVAQLEINGEDVFLSWKTIPNWGWLIYGFGEVDDYLAVNQQQMWVQLGIMLAGTLIISLLIRWLTRRILRPVHAIVLGMQSLGNGDLSQEISASPEGSKNEVHILQNSLRSTQSALRRAIGLVRGSVVEIHTGAREIAVGNADLSSRTEEQAASLQETAASMEQLSATVRQNAENARQADQLATSAATTARQGESAVHGMVETMQRIADSSARINDIIGVINSIAFQTNILALNAAVEAARAGEEGRGFAVVAGEVRALAQRSADAADEIRGLIEASANEVESGTRQANTAGNTMSEVLTAVDRVNHIMAEIASASSEQTTGIEQVNLAIMQMDQVTQQNAALVEEAAAAAGSLREQADRLAETVALFRTGNDQEDIVARHPEAGRQLQHSHSDKPASLGYREPPRLPA